MLATDWGALGARPDLVPAAAAISGLFDLTPLTLVSMNQDLLLTEADARAASPLFWPAPSGRTFEAWCGALESSEFRRQNLVIAEAWARAGVATFWQELTDANHFTVLDPLADPSSALTGRLAALVERAHKAG
jgi:arylformamidase